MFEFLRRLFGSSSDSASAPARPAVDTEGGQNGGGRVSLEEQLTTLQDLGLELEEGITVDDMLYSFDREGLENPPYDLVLFLLGCEVEREPWGRRFCRRVWNFDPECIEGPGSYVEIVESLSELANASSRVTQVEDEIDLDSGQARLRYSIDGERREWQAEVNDDWADSMVVSYVMDDLERDGHRFYGKDNGQASILFYLDEETAAALNRLTGNSLSPAVV